MALTATLGRDRVAIKLSVEHPISEAEALTRGLPLETGRLEVALLEHRDDAKLLTGLLDLIIRPSGNWCIGLYNQWRPVQGLRFELQAGVGEAQGLAVGILSDSLEDFLALQSAERIFFWAADESAQLRTRSIEFDHKHKLTALATPEAFIRTLVESSSVFCEVETGSPSVEALGSWSSLWRVLVRLEREVQADQ